MKKALVLGLVSALFFGFAFLMNRQMSLEGGSWLWTACLRYLFMFPILLVMVGARRQLRPVLRAVAARPGAWFLWSSVGFGIFYTTMSASSVFGPAWLITGTWQLTVVTGALLTPLFFTVEQTPQGPVRRRMRIPREPVLFGCVILAGIAMMQIQEAVAISPRNAAMSTLLVLVSAITYPLGNRKMMEVCADELNTVQRVFGMTLCSLPYWAVVAACGFGLHGAPAPAQVAQSFWVAVVSGVAATLLYFHATSLVRHNPAQLAVVEATVAAEVIFVLAGGVLLFRDTPPTPLALAGMGVVMVGMVLNSLFAAR